MDDTHELLLEPRHQRQSAHLMWVQQVRRPAEQHNEGVRQLIAANGAAIADYNLAPLPNGRWAVTIHCAYHCGNCHGIGIPWTLCKTREDGLQLFLTIAHRHFGYDLDRDGSASQQAAQKEMLDLLMEGLFGFVEPEPLPG